MRKKIQPRNLTHLEHIKRNGSGSGSHGDKKKQANKMACRGKIDKRSFSVLAFFSQSVILFTSTEDTTMSNKKQPNKIKKRNVIHQIHIEQNRKAGSHRDKSKYTRKDKHKKQHTED